MSYCRFSSDNFGSDFYIYGTDNDNICIHVASSRLIFDGPIPPEVNIKDIDAYVAREAKVINMALTAKREPIELPRLESFVGCIEDAIVFLKKAQELGYRVPKYVIPMLEEELNDDNQAL